MKYPVLLYLFGIDLFIDLIWVYFGFNDMRFTSKSLLMILLFIFVLFQDIRPRVIRFLLLAAIIFSLLGDIALLVPLPSYFIGGLLSFLAAHLFYICLFVVCRKINGLKFKPVEYILFGALYIALFFFSRLETLNLGDLSVAVFVYSCVLLTMMLIIINSFHFKKQDSAKMILAGGILFVISDFLLAFDKFVSQFRNAGVLIMLTYALAQLLIATGVIKFTHSIDKH